ncbi:MAG TPA: hypothetical protein VMZ69_07255, partial [Saprospiraceae bacterium]|nr:hypothetical protein [Saprospiraceae bacterium]
MKYILPIAIAMSICACKEKNTITQVEDPYTREDLVLMKWIEGNWVGDYHGEPFYETYKLVNDSTLSIRTYSKVGTDAPTSTEEFIFWQDDGYYMGEGLKYKVVKLDAGEIKMFPVNASNEVYWKRVDDSTWAAELAGKTDTAYYILRKVSPEMD